MPYKMPKTPVTSDRPILSEAAHIKGLLEHYNHDRWGFMIYRCTYGDDAAWDHFMNIITTRAQTEILASDTEEIIDTFEWKVFDDRETFHNTSTASLREHFNQWVRDNWQREQPRAKFKYTPRYGYFIRVDQKALDSVLNGSRHMTPSVANAGWVDFVDASWTADLDDVDSETEEIDLPDLSFEPVEGCREEDVGWLKVPADRICTELYSTFMCNSLWTKLYTRPPAGPEPAVWP